MSGIEIGWGIDKGISVLQLSYKIYEAFADPERNASQQFRNLASEFSAFHVIFEKLVTLLKKYEKPLLISPSSIQFTLDKCLLLQQKFGILNEPSTKSTALQRVKFVGRTLQWSFHAEKLANELRAELARHERILTLLTQTLALENSLEERVTNSETRKTNREIFHLVSNLYGQEETSEGDPLDLPNVPRHELEPPAHARSRFPEVPSHEPTRRETTRSANLEAAYDNLEALKKLLERGSHAIAEFESPGNRTSSDAFDAIDVARQEVEIQLKRVDNYRKRVSHLPPSRSSTIDSQQTTRYDSGSPILPCTNTQGEQVASSSARRRRSTLTRQPSHDVSNPITPANILEINPAIQTRNHNVQCLSRQNTDRRRYSSVSTSSSLELQKLLENFKKDLEELDIDAQVAKTQEELFNLVQRSFPPSPDLRINPLPSPAGSLRFNLDSGAGISSSPPGMSQMRPPLRSPTVMSNNSRRLSVDGSDWKWLAKEVHVDDIPYSCAKCSSVENTGLQVAQRGSGGLCFRLLCISPMHKTSDGILLRHDLRSDVPGYPHIYHRGTDINSQNSVRVLGHASRLEAYAGGRKHTLRVQPSAGPLYKFSSTEDSEAFQSLIHGAELVKRFDVKAISSSAQTGNPCRFVPVRLWRSLSTDMLEIMLHANLADRYDPFAYIEKITSFSPPTTSGNKVKLKVTDALQSPRIGHKRTKSRDSFMSSESDEMRNGGRLSPRMKIEWLDIEFENRADRDAFLTIWKQS